MTTRTLSAMLAIALLSSALAACGASSKGGSLISNPSKDTGTASTTTAAVDPLKADADKDNDVGAPYDDTNNNRAATFGHPATAAQQRAVGAMLARYYATALAGNGAMACSMIISSLAEAVAEDYGRGSAGPPYLKSGTTCPSVMDLVFQHSRRELVAEVPKLKVSRVRLAGHHGVAILNFGTTLPEREISVGEQRHVWKVLALLDTELP